MLGEDTVELARGDPPHGDRFDRRDGRGSRCAVDDGEFAEDVAGNADGQEPQVPSPAGGLDLHPAGDHQQDGARGAVLPHHDRAFGMVIEPAGGFGENSALGATQ